MLNDFLKTINIDDLRYDECLIKYLKLFNYNYDVILTHEYKLFYRANGVIAPDNLIMVVGLILFNDNDQLIISYLSYKLNVEIYLLEKYFIEWKKESNYDYSLFVEPYNKFIENIEKDMLISKKAYYDEYSVIFIAYSNFLEKLNMISSQKYISSLLTKYKTRSKLKEAIIKYMY